MQICKVKIEKKAKNSVFCGIFRDKNCIFEIIVVPLQPLFAKKPTGKSK